MLRESTCALLALFATAAQALAQTPSKTQAIQPRLTINCSSEDDGEVSAVIPGIAGRDGSFGFEARLPGMSRRPMIELKVHAFVYRNAVQSFSLCAMQRGENTALTCSRLGGLQSPLDAELFTGVYATGMTDPEGLGCSAIIEGMN